MGSVWIGRNEVTGADVALKVLRPERAELNDVLTRFRYEARLGSMLHHRSITRAFDLIEEPDNTLVLVMELLRGETLQACLKERQTLPPREAVAIAVPILSALDHAHEMGIVHRDVKPANIYLAMEPDGHVIPKLLDFGIAKGQSLNAHTLEGKVLGTPAYMSPEQIRAASDELTGRSDLFSMAVVLYEMLTGKPPFDAGVPSATLAAVLELKVDPDPRIEPRLWLEIERALSKRPNERHESARAMAMALCEAVGETEGGLAGSLRRTRPPPPTELDDLPTREEAMPPPEPLYATNAIAVSRSINTRRRTPTTAWIAGGAALAVLIFVLTAVTLTRSRPSVSNATPSSPSATASAPEQEPNAKPPPSAEALNTDTATPVANPSGTAHGPPTRVKTPRNPRRAKPIATTPGF
jgi:serine/threonine-protein kinase